MSLAGKCALVTGGSRGIGRGIALSLAQRGAKVAINYVQNEAAAKDTLAKVREAKSDGLVVQAGVTDPKQVERMFAKVKDSFGALDIFVHNARTEVPSFFAPPDKLTLEQWDTALNSQAKAFFLGTRLASGMMPDGGRILAITYAAGSVTGSWQPWVAMGAAKAAMESVCRYWAVALARRGITVNAVSPGWIEDSVLNSLPDAVQNSLRTWNESGWTPMRRLGTPADIGKVVALLCSEDAGWVTGQTIYADGGASLMNPGLPLELQGL